MRRRATDQGIVVAGSRDYAVALTKEGRNLIEHSRDRNYDDRQTFFWERRRPLNEVPQPDPAKREDAAAPAVGE
jgi:hypothetical protein